MCFKYAITVAPSHGNTGKHPKENQGLNSSHINTIGKKEIFLQSQKAGKSLKQGTKQSLLCSVFTKK